MNYYYSNFREGASGKSGGGGSKLQTKANRTKRSRDMGLTSQSDDIHYRTHLFFSPNRPGYDVGEEQLIAERCSGFTGNPSTSTTNTTGTLPLSPIQHESMDAPQPLVDRKPSVSLLRWNNNNHTNGNNNSNSNITTNIHNYHHYQSPLPPPPPSATTTATPSHRSSFRKPIDSIQMTETNRHNNNANINYNKTSGYNTTPGSSTLLQQHQQGLAGLSSTAAVRQASYGITGSGSAMGPNNGLVSMSSGGVRSEPISLATLDRDCFIIPVHSVDRFLPAGIPLPPSPVDGNSTKPSSPLSVLEVSDPKLCILVHLMSPLEPIDPVLESPLAHPLLKQRSVASELLTEVQQANTAVGGMLLANMEKISEFPFITYYVINTTQTDPSNFYSGIRVSSLSKFEPKNLRYTAAHTLDLYSEVAAICRPPLQLAPSESGSFKKTQTPATGYIISVFKVFEGDDGERFEKNWLYWTGARMLYRYLPRTAGLRRISLHKSTSQRGDKMYLLICECAELLKDINAAAVLIPALRARLCGYTGLYRPIQAF
ncbi:phosphatidylinositol 3-kinase 2-like isoform X3 [Musca domestica]|uniref:Phosphatidylinositol 3-kinase 2-like isoform X3 n=1 Tax=Musca domestica TaxID=7370 RepID=A0ABM3VGK8_MUSDO|nr:phosphatidylinositol 3-kinase 2-like isoform X3 [Musca domestica]